MRVISGVARGTKLISQEGLDTRPTLDRVKEALFSIIQFELKGKSILDLFFLLIHNQHCFPNYNS